MSREPPASDAAPGGRWEAEAENWLRWARTPGHDSYWTYAPLFFDAVLPSPSGRTLELGCGEGRVVRDLSRRGHRVVGVDLSPTLIAAARHADPDGTYVRADAAALPFVDGSFDLVVAYNSLMDVDDMPGTVVAVAGALTSGGRFCICVTHPLNDAGAFEGNEEDDEDSARFVIGGTYGRHRRFDETFERNGLRITFHGWTYSIEHYSRALEDAGLLIELIREPSPPESAVAENPRYRKWQRIPVFLHIRAIKP